MKGILWQKQSNTHTLNWQFKSESRARLGTLGKRVARSSWDIGKRVARSSWGIGKRVARSSCGFPKQPTARSNDTLLRSWQATFWSCIKHCWANDAYLYWNYKIYSRKLKNYLRNRRLSLTGSLEATLSIKNNGCSLGVTVVASGLSVLSL